MLLSFTTLAVAFAIGAANSNNVAGKSDNQYVEVGAKKLSTAKNTHGSQWFGAKPQASQWFSANLVSPEGGQGKHMQKGFHFDEAWARRASQMKSHTHTHTYSLEEGSQGHTRISAHAAQGQHQKIHANAGIPILQAAKTKSERDSWPRDIDDPEPGDGFEGPRDVENNPGDALLELKEEATEKKFSLVRRELTSYQEGDVLTETESIASKCEKCKSCKEAEPNKPDNKNHTDGVWCMCHSWAEWTKMKTAPGVYPGQSELCNPSVCVKNMTNWKANQCDSLNCSCDLNVYWASPS